jgi:mannosyltransferase
LLTEQRRTSSPPRTPLPDRPPVRAARPAHAWLLLGGAVLAGALLRFPFLDHQSFWLDETYTATIAGKHSLSGVWSSVTDTESTPPLYYLLTWSWTSLAGSTSEAALRATGATAGLLAVPVSFFAVRGLVGERVGLAVAWLCATSPLLVWYSLDARAYSLLVLASMLSVWGLANLIERATTRRWALWALAGVACIWTHYYGAFLIGGELAVIVWRRPELRRALAAWTGVIVLCTLPLLPTFLEQRGDTARTAWIGQRPLLERIEQAVREHAMGPNVPSAALEGLGLTIAAAAFLAGLVIAMRAGRNTASLVVLAAGGIGLPLLLSVTGVADHFFVRNLLMVWVALAAVAALALVRLGRAPLIAYLMLSVAIVLATQADWRYQNADWRGAVAKLHASAGRSPIVVYPGLQSPVPAHYLRRDGPLAPARPDEAWVVVEPVRHDDRDLEPVDEAPPAGMPGVPFERVGTRAYHGFRLVRFRAPRAARIDGGALARHPVRGFPPALLGP